MYNFAVMGKKGNTMTTLEISEADTVFSDNADIMSGKKLCDYLYGDRYLVYTYDFGDSWEHRIRINRVIEECDIESPYLVEAKGKTPPEDVGGVPGFCEFVEIISNPSDPEYENLKSWNPYWNPELSDWEKCPRVLDI